MPTDRRIKIKGEVFSGDKILGVPSLTSFTHVMSIVFYSSAEMLPEHAVSKASMSGELTFYASETGVEYTPLNDPTITLGEVDYARPLASGSYTNFKMNMNNVTGATHYILCIASAGGV